MSEKKNAVVYVRVEQGQESMSMMHAQMVSMLGQSLGVNVLGFVSKVGDVPMKEILPALKSQVIQFDLILTMNKDSISKDIAELLGFIKECKNTGIDIHTVSDGNLAEFLDKLQAVFVANDREVLSDLTYERMRRKAEAGYCMGGKAPIGYIKMTDGSLAIDSEKACIINDIFDWYLNGFSLSTIARMIADKWDLHYGRKGRWKVDKIAYILSNPIYNGYPTWGKSSQAKGVRMKMTTKDKWVKASKQLKHLAIIEDKRFEAVQKKLESECMSIRRVAGFMGVE